MWRKWNHNWNHRWVKKKKSIDIIMVFLNSFHFTEYFCYFLTSKPPWPHLSSLCPAARSGYLLSILQNPFSFPLHKSTLLQSLPSISNNFSCHSLSSFAPFAHSGAFQSSAIIPAFQAGHAVRKFSSAVNHLLHKDSLVLLWTAHCSQLERKGIKSEWHCL